MAGACDYNMEEEEGDDEVFKPDVETADRSQMGGERGDQILPPNKRSNTIDRYGFIRAPGLPDPNIQDIMPREVYITRERKWIEMLGNWDLWMNKRFIKVKSRCRKGIPHSVRAKAWQCLSCSKDLQSDNRKMYKVYVQRPISSKQDMEIKNDLHRSFPNHQLFVDNYGPGQKQLYNVLRAYTAYNPSDGFCQAHAPIVSVLLMHMPEEEAFWCLVAMIKSYLPNYYGGQLEEVKYDGQILFNLLKKVHPKLHKRMKELHIDGPLFMVQWFMCLFSRDLPWPSVLRIWDIFFCEGVKILFRVALVLLKHSTDHLKKIPNDFYDLLDCLKTKNMNPEFLQPDFLLDECFRLPVTDKDLSREHKRLVKAREKERANTNRS